MEQNYQSTKLPTVGASSAIGGASAWSNPSRITADDGSSASWGAFAGAQQSLITGSSFGFQQLPASAIVDGILVYVDGSQVGCYGDVTLNITGSTGKPIGAFGSYGGATDLWGKTSISVAEIAALSVGVQAIDVSGGDGIASIDCIKVTVFWHIEVTTPPAEVPTRLVHKVYTGGGRYLGRLPAASQIAFSQEINSAGSTAQITCGTNVDPVVSVDPITDQDDDPITTETGEALLATESVEYVAAGDAEEEVIFKNGNRVKTWLYNYWHPNGKLIFSGQINKIGFKSGGGQARVQLLVYSDGIDLDNFIARGYPFAYTTDVTQDAWNAVVNTSTGSGDKFSGWLAYGQTFKVGGAVDNIGAITLKLRGSANVTVQMYDGPNGNLLSSVSRNLVGVDQPDSYRFEFPQLVPVTPGGTYFFAVWADPGQNIDIYWQSTSPYADGEAYESSYGGGSGGGSFLPYGGDIWFITASGEPTTTTTYTSDDPISEMAHGILLDYNARGGIITERDFTPAGYTLTNTFNSASIFEAIKKCIELAPSTYYSYVDLGTAEMDILATSTTPDFVVVLGKDINDIEVVLSIENVKNQLLLSGGDIGGGVNLFKQYQDTESAARYGTRLALKSDNRITLDATADAFGESFIDENSDEVQETPLTILNKNFDITLLVPGKTIGFRNGGGLIDNMILRIARRDYKPQAVNLILGRLPMTTSAEFEKIRRDLLQEQTINNPTAPS